jgi:hypothetical protein
MNAIKLAGIALLIVGSLALAYGGFTYTKETQEAKLGPIALTINEQKTVNIPVWAGVLALVAGGLLLFVPRAK